MPGPLQVSSDIRIPEHELVWRFSRSGGPGGQAVNTSDTRVALSFDVRRTTALDDRLRERALHRLDHRLVDGVLTVVASEHRSQLRNRSAAEQRLAATLRTAVAPPRRARRATKPTKGSQRRRLDAKRQRGQTKRLRRDTAD